jgi:hypothetical protein
MRDKKNKELIKELKEKFVGELKKELKKRRRTAKEPKSSLMVRVDSKHLMCLKRLCLESGITVTHAISKYLRYIYQRHNKKDQENENINMETGTIENVLAEFDSSEERTDN